MAAARAARDGESAWPDLTARGSEEHLRSIAAHWNVYETPAGQTRLLFRPFSRLARWVLRRMQARALVQQSLWNGAVSQLLTRTVRAEAEREARQDAKASATAEVNADAWPLERVRACEERLAALEREISALHVELARRRAASAPGPIKSIDSI